MKAALLRAFGERLTIEDLPQPQPGAGEALVETCGPAALMAPI